MTESPAPMRFQFLGELYPTLERALRAAYWDYLNGTPFGFEGADDERWEEAQAADDPEALETLEAELHGEALSEALQEVIFCDGLALNDENLRERAAVAPPLLDRCLEAMKAKPVYMVRAEAYDFIETALLACFLEWNGGEVTTAEELAQSPLVNDLAHWLQNIIVVDGVRLHDWNVEFLSPHDAPLMEQLYGALQTLEEP